MKKWQYGLILLVLIVFLGAYFFVQGSTFNATSDGLNFSVKTACSVEKAGTSDKYTVSAKTTVTAKRDITFVWNCCQTPETAQKDVIGNKTTYYGTVCSRGPQKGPQKVGIGNTTEFTGTGTFVRNAEDRYVTVTTNVTSGKEILTTRQRVNLGLGA